MNLDSLFSERSKALKPSIIRALLGLVQNPKIISFAGGTPDASLFPLELMAELSGKVILEQGRLSLQYGETQGWRPLRDALSRYLATKGIQANAEEILITNGSQQGIDLLSRVLLDPGDLVGVENPGYLGALITYNNYQARLLPLEMDQDGLLPEALEEALKAGKKPKLLYLTPSFQNPSGRLLSQARRLKILELCETHQILLAEDDPYGEINFGEPYQPIKAFDKAGAVVFLGSFSKIASPGMRLGWAVGPKELIGKMVMAKESADVCTNVLSQAMAAEFLDGGHLGPHLELLIQTYASRARAMVKAVRAQLGKELEVEDPKGGFFLWGRLAEGQRGGEGLFKECLEAGIAYVPGSVFFAEPSQGEHSLRLTYCAVDEAKIEEGVARLAKVLQSAKARV